MNVMMGVLEKIDQAIDRMTRILIVICVLSMIFFTLLVIIGRFFHAAYPWVDPLVRHLVFLGAFLGGVLATGARQHLGIDFVNKNLEQKNKIHLKRYIESILYFFSSLVLIALAITGKGFVLDAFKFEGVAFLGIKRGFLVLIIPIGSLLLAYRFLFQALWGFFPNSLKTKRGN